MLSFWNLFNYQKMRDLGFLTDILENNQSQFSADFINWLPENMHVFSAFVKQAKYVRKVMRRDHYSARTIGEWLRHNSMVRGKGDTWKLNDHYWPGLARLSMLAYPELSGLFETRGGKL